MLLTGAYAVPPMQPLFEQAPCCQLVEVMHNCCGYALVCCFVSSVPSDGSIDVTDPSHLLSTLLSFLLRCQMQLSGFGPRQEDSAVTNCLIPVHAWQASAALTQPAEVTVLHTTGAQSVCLHHLKGNWSLLSQEEAAAASHIRQPCGLGSHCHARHCHHVSGHGLQRGHEQQAKQRTGGAADSFQLCGNQRCAQLAGRVELTAYNYCWMEVHLQICSSAEGSVLKRLL